MEKRLLLFFMVSFGILIAWSAIFPPPRPPVKKITQVIEDNKDIEIQEEKSIASSPSIAPAVSIKEEIEILENTKIKVEFSNHGGTIKSITIKEFNTTLPITKIFTIPAWENTHFNARKDFNNTITYEAQINGQKVVKEYKLSDDHVIDINVQSDKMSNLKTDKMSNLKITGYILDTSTLDKKITDSIEKTLYEYSVAQLTQIVRKGDAIEFGPKDAKDQAGEVTWIGFRDRYFCVVVKPNFKTKEFSITPEEKKKLAITLIPESNQSNYGAKIYVGPQKLKLLGSYNQGFEQIMVFSNWGILDICSKIIYFIIHFLQHLVKNWGVAIILLGIFIYGATYPLTAKSMASMRKMQALQPKMKALQEKYKSDPQRMNKEVMELYKENKVNPFGGCLPMLLQMPIFIGLYQVLWRSVDFKGANFLWIKDLSEPDRLFIFPFNIPFVGNEFNILPLLMAVTMFFQQKFSSKNMVVTDPNQLMQQKMMLYMMPIMMAFIFYHFASGLTLYFTVFYVLSTLTQWKMSKQVL